MFAKGLKTTLWAAALIGATFGPAHAQEDKPGPFGPMKLELSEDGKSYLRFITWHQFWTRLTDLNPDSTVNGSGQDLYPDFGIRRSRFLIFGELQKRVLVLFHIGINNQVFNGDKKPQVFVHDAWTQFRVLDEALYIGFGIHYWNGISRMSNSSTFKYLALDAPILNWPTIEASDQFARMMGIYAKGKIGRFDYRVAVNKPFTSGPDDGPENPLESEAAVYNGRANTWAYAGYFQYNFLDIESNLLPFMAGSYLGKKKVFTLGAGFLVQPDGMHSLNSEGNRETHLQLSIGVDAFAEIPLGQGAGALTAYLVFYHFDFGPDHLRNVGIMNFAEGGSSANGPGNRYPVIGTGEHVYFQVGYMLPINIDLQPYFGTQVSAFEALDGISVMLEGGVNWYILGQNAKLTLHYRARPVFERDTTNTENPEEPSFDTFASELILQTQLLF